MRSLDPQFYSELMKKYPNLTVVQEDVQFLDSYYPPAMDLIPEKYRQYVKSRLLMFGLEFDGAMVLELFQLRKT